MKNNAVTYALRAIKRRKMVPTQTVCLPDCPQPMVCIMSCHVDTALAAAASVLTRDPLPGRINKYREFGLRISAYMGTASHGLLLKHLRCPVQDRVPPFGIETSEPRPNDAIQEVPTTGESHVDLQEAGPSSVPEGVGQQHAPRREASRPAKRRRICSATEPEAARARVICIDLTGADQDQTLMHRNLLAGDHAPPRALDHQAPTPIKRDDDLAFGQNCDPMDNERMGRMSVVGAPAIGSWHVGTQRGSSYPHPPPVWHPIKAERNRDDRRSQTNLEPDVDRKGVLCGATGGDEQPRGPVDGSDADDLGTSSERKHDHDIIDGMASGIGLKDAEGKGDRNALCVWHCNRTTGEQVPVFAARRQWDTRDHWVVTYGYDALEGAQRAAPDVRKWWSVREMIRRRLLSPWTSFYVGLMTAPDSSKRIVSISNTGLFEACRRWIAMSVQSDGRAQLAEGERLLTRLLRLCASAADAEHGRECAELEYDLSAALYRFKQQQQAAAGRSPSRAQAFVGL
jgi:hypothetical protein